MSICAKKKTMPRDGAQKGGRHVEEKEEGGRKGGREEMREERREGAGGGCRAGVLRATKREVSTELPNRE